MRARASHTIPVLVVDDDESFLRVASSVLAATLTPPNATFAVSTVRTGGEAVAFLERLPPFADAPRPAFVILDLRLPDMDAPAVLARLTADGGPRRPARPGRVASELGRRRGRVAQGRRHRVPYQAIQGHRVAGHRDGLLSPPRHGILNGMNVPADELRSSVARIVR